MIKVNIDKFEHFVSGIKHELKCSDCIKFIKKQIEMEIPLILWNNGDKIEAMYLLAIIDTISNLHEIPLCDIFNDIRVCRLETPYFPSGIIRYAKCFNLSPIECISIENVPNEFSKINIMEDDIYEYIIEI